MNLKFRPLYQAAAAVGFMLAAPACAHPHSTPSPQPNQAAAAVGMELGPALWKVADEDTTIYLFGTVHFLPKEAQWLEGQIKRAIDNSDTLVTEINGQEAVKNQQRMLTAGTLPRGTTLRSQMPSKDKRALEKALRNQRIPIDSLDSYKPWLAAIILATNEYVLNGFTQENGSESVLAVLTSAGMPSDHLESAQSQIDMFDKMAEADQWAYLGQTIEALPDTKKTLQTVYTEWTTGDVQGLAAVMDFSESDPELYKRLLTNRNANWAGWIDDRLDAPGTVFVAVGAAHLAGKGSVQEYLAERGIPVTRLQ